jgi:predicted nucleotidyltransferase component of viral defense system
MPGELYLNTVSPLLLGCLQKLMQTDQFAEFRLVGGTALSLQLGHRISVDIDLFTEATYGSIDFNAIEHYLRNTFDYVDTAPHPNVGIGKPFFIGRNEQESVKLDLFYCDPFVFPAVQTGWIRMADVRDIIAMKLQVIASGGRKKDFWDLHELLDHYSIQSMIAFHAARYPHEHDEAQLLAGLTNFANADHDFEPLCQRGKHWELIRLDIIQALHS